MKRKKDKEQDKDLNFRQGRELNVFFGSSEKQKVFENLEFRFDSASPLRKWVTGTEKNKSTKLHKALAECFTKYVYAKTRNPEDPFQFFSNSKAAFTIFFGKKNSGGKHNLVFSDDYQISFYGNIFKFKTEDDLEDVEETAEGDELDDDEVAAKTPPVVSINETFLPASCVKIFVANTQITEPLELEALLKMLCKDFVPIGGFSAVKRCRLPSPLDLKVVGRRDLIDEGEDYLNKYRLVTLHAMAGSGKSTVIVEIAKRLCSKTRYSVFYIDARENTSGSDLAHSIQRLLKLPLLTKAVPRELHEELAEHLQERGKVILVLDNFEQIGVASPGEEGPNCNEIIVEKLARETVEAWLTPTTDLKILVGCRVSLSLTGREHALKVDPLTWPTIEQAQEMPEKELREFYAVQLFLEYAAIKAPESVACENSIRAAARLVARLNGFPAAIVYAVELLENNTLWELSEKYQRVFSNPGHGLIYGLEQIYDMITPLQGWILLQAARFRGGFTLEAAQRIIRDQTSGELDEDFLSTQLARLVKVNLLRCTTSGRNARYSFYTPVEEWAERKWNKMGIAKTKTEHAARFAEYFCELFEAANKKLESTYDTKGMNSVIPERYNLLDCHVRAVKRGDAQTAYNVVFLLLPILRLQGPAILLKETLESTMAIETKDLPLTFAQNAKLHKALAECLFSLGEYERTLEVSSLSVEFAKQDGGQGLRLQCEASNGDLNRMTVGSHIDIAEWEKLEKECLSLGNGKELLGYGDVCLQIGAAYDKEGLGNKSLAKFDHAVAEFERRGISSASPIADFMLTRIVNSKGISAWHAGQLSLAQETLEKALEGFTHQNIPMWIAGSKTNLGFVHIDKGEFSKAAKYLDEAGELHRAVGNKGFESVNNVATARLYLRQKLIAKASQHCIKIEDSVVAVKFMENILLMRSIQLVAMSGISEPDETYKFFKEMFGGTQKLPKYRRFFETHLIGAECAMMLGRLDEAHECIQLAAEVATLRNLQADKGYYGSIYGRFEKLRQQLA
ncbi:MAG: AAA family ATPase [Chthoniobacteraceae bacterium]